VDIALRFTFKPCLNPAAKFYTSSASSLVENRIRRECCCLCNAIPDSGLYRLYPWQEDVLTHWQNFVIVQQCFQSQLAAIVDPLRNIQLVPEFSFKIQVETSTRRCTVENRNLP
jgi:hypothetical protein